MCCFYVVQFFMRSCLFPHHAVGKGKSNKRVVSMMGAASPSPSENANTPIPSHSALLAKHTCGESHCASLHMYPFRCERNVTFVPF